MIDNYLPTLLKKEFTSSPFSAFDKFFDEALMTVPGYKQLSRMSPLTKSVYPKVNVLDKDKELIVEAAIPGMTKDDIRIELEDEILTIVGNKTNEDNTKNNDYICREVSKSSFRRSWHLGDNLDVDNIKAKTEDGMLFITIPKLKEEVNKNKKEIKIS